jgi:hypothetical protein
MTETLLTVQSFPLDAPGGGPRIMRSLLAESPWRVISVATGPGARPSSDEVEEHVLPMRPNFGRLESTRFKQPLDTLAYAHARSLRARIEELIRSRSITAVHSIVHGMDFVAASSAAQRSGVPLFLSIHDHPVYTFAARSTRLLALRSLGPPWRAAAHRYVISRELGDDLKRRLGDAPYSVVTDGVSELRAPHGSSARRCRVYFMGAFHLSYRENLRSLLKGLALYRDRASVDASVVLRGGGPVLSTDQRAGIPVETLPWGSQQDVEADLNNADFVYFPLPFGAEHEQFVRFSLSTKMVTFLACGLPILFHGPSQSVAARILEEHDAAVSAYSLEPAAVCMALESAQESRDSVVAAAQRLATERFRIDDQRQRFWSPMLEYAPPRHPEMA